MTVITAAVSDYALLERFFARVDQTGDCWVWKGLVNRQHYGIFSRGRRYSRSLAHRWAFEMFRGPIPEGLLVCHSCDNPSCVNPAHLFLGTHKDNTDDMMRKGRKKTSPRGGVLNGRAKLDEQGVRRIRELRKQGVTCAELAAQFGIHKNTAMKIVGRRLWAGVA